MRATDAFGAGVAGAAYRQVIDTVLPRGAFELAVADIDTFSGRVAGLAAVACHRRGGLAHPATRALGSEWRNRRNRYKERHALIEQWMPHAETLVVLQTTHALRLMNSSAIADGLSSF